MSTIGTFYAIRVKDSLKYLPECYGRGYTYSEPVAGPQPRLFHTEHAAKIALTAWLKGHAVVQHSYDWESGHTEYCGLQYHAQADRHREDMEIVPVTLTVAS